MGPILFALYINDLTDVLKCYHLLYADDVKLIEIIRSTDSCLNLQQDLYALAEWTKKWSMDLNLKKCKRMHLGKSNQNFVYSIKENGLRYQLPVTLLENDLGVHIISDLKWESQVSQSVNKANRTLGMLRNSFKYVNKKSFRLLYSSLVRPHLEYGNSVWHPYLKKDIDSLERVQRTATKLVRSISHKPYESRLKDLKIL